MTGSIQVLAVAADPHGFVSAGSHDNHPAVWTTSDGRQVRFSPPGPGAAWTQTKVSGLGGGSDAITALASSGPSVTGIGSTATMASQRFLLLALPPA